jgi:hypothetical protein
MPTLEPNERHVLSERPVDPVPRAEVEAYLQRFKSAASPLTADGQIDQMNWDAWRSLRADDYFIQWNLYEGKFRITLDEYIERWQWTVRQGRGWESLDSKVHIIDTGFIVEGMLRSRHTDANGRKFVLPLCETYHIKDGKALFSNEYVDPTYLRERHIGIPGGW